MNRTLQVAVVGAGTASAAELEVARRLGAALASHGAVVVCGGLGGVMAAACRGAREAGGRTVGIVPGPDRSDANPWADIVIATGLGHARNILVVQSTDAVVALPGSHGTRSEVSIALKIGRPVVGLGAWNELEGVLPAATPGEAASLAVQRAQGA